MALRSGILAFVLVMLVASTFAQAAGGHRGPSTFEGTCQFSGSLRQTPAVTNLPQPGEAVARALGTCSGTLTDKHGRVRQLSSSRARYAARAQGNISCGGGSAEGRGFIRVGGRRLRFHFSEVRGPGAAAIKLDGTAGGSAAGEARISDEEDPVDIAQKCSGEGLRQVRVDIDLATTPALSG